MPEIIATATPRLPMFGSVGEDNETQADWNESATDSYARSRVMGELFRREASMAAPMETRTFFQGSRPKDTWPLPSTWPFLHLRHQPQGTGRERFEI